MNSAQRTFSLYRGIVTSVILILIAVAIGIGVVFPALRQVNTLYAQVKALTKETTELQKKLVFLGSLDEQTLSDQLRVLSVAVPLDKSFATALSTVEAIGAQSGVTMGVVNFEAPGSISTEAAQLKSEDEKKLGTGVIEFTTSIKGDFEQVTRFIATLPTVRRIVSLKRFILSVTPEGGMSLQGTFHAFYAPLGRSSQGESGASALSSEEEALLLKISALPLLGIGDFSAPLVPASARENPFGL